MIRVLGAKRLFILLVLLGLTAGFAGVLYLHLTPEKIKKERELRGVRGKISGIQADIDRLQVEFEQLEDQQVEFEALKAKGFFSNQNRREAEKVLEKIQQEAKVISAVASIQPGEFVEDAEAAKANHKILSSKISVRLEALDDVDIYRYLYLVQSAFPGHITFETIDMARKSDVTEVILRAIASGANPPLVQADVEMTWRTMIPAENGSDGQGGAL